MIQFHLLASGSKGNCCVVKSNFATILIDCGYKIRHLKKCFKEIGVDDFDVMFITHQHSDHISQLKHFKHLPIISSNVMDVDDLTLCKPFDFFHIKDMKITVLPLSHDIENTYGLLIESGNESLVYICDTGYVSSKVQSFIQNKTYYVIESNHDIQMLMQSNRSMFLKQRIAGDIGHLNNEDCSVVLQNVVGDSTKQVFLAHLSQDCNCEEIAFKTTKKVLHHDIELFIAKQDAMVSGGYRD